MQTVSDETIIKKVQAGDAKAFSELLARYQQPVFAFIYHLVRNKSDAEDIFQEVFLKVLGHIRQYQHHEKFKSWVMTIANNLAIDKIRKEKLVEHVSLESPAYATLDHAPELKETIAGSAERPDAAYEKKELAKHLEQAVQNLPFEQRQVFLLREQSGLSFKEIAKLLGCPLNTALGRMHYALENLRKQLTKTLAGGY